MLANTNQRKTISGKRNSGRKLTLTESDRRTLRKTVSKNHRITAAQVTGHQSFMFILKTLFPQNNVQRQLHKSNIHGSGKAAIGKPLITKSNAQIRKR
jgi:hypothetical protein